MPKARLKAGVDQLNVRTVPKISAPVAGQLMPGRKVDVIRVCKGDDGAIWLQIGYNQYCALLYKGKQYLEFVKY